jgi:serine/threonine-protein phosphatase CPPED1
MRTRLSTRLLLFALILAAFCLAAFAQQKSKKLDAGEIRVVQISDLHIGLKSHPEGEEHSEQAVALINKLRPDLVLVSGDIAENNEDARARAAKLLRKIEVPYKTVPGNHDVHDDDMGAYRAAFGEDFYSFDFAGFRFLALNSQLMGNYDNFNAKEPVRNAGKGAQESERMFKWLASLPESDKPTFAFQHVPITHDGAPDNKVYWGVSDPYLGKEMAQLKRLGVKHLFAGHWHNPQTKDVDGITVHVAPAVSYGIKSDQVGVMLYTIQRSGEVKAELIPLEVAQ